MLRRYDADVPPTAVGVTPSMLECTFNAFVSARIVDGRTPHSVDGAECARQQSDVSGQAKALMHDGTFQRRSHGRT